jgi:hypothetical protein
MAFVGVSTEVHAFTFLHYDSRGPVKWRQGFRIHRDICSMPTDSDEDWAYYNAGYQWSRFQSVMDWNWWYNNDCRITQGNGRNEVGVVERSEIAGNDGVTWLHYAVMFPLPQELEYTEADVAVASDMRYDNQDGGASARVRACSGP